MVKGSDTLLLSFTQQRIEKNLETRVADAKKNGVDFVFSDRPRSIPIFYNIFFEVSLSNDTKKDYLKRSVNKRLEKYDLFIRKYN